MHTLRILTVSLAILGLASSASAKPLLAVLDFSESRTGLHEDELSVLGDVSRGAALKTLGHEYDVITRENLVDLLKAHGKFLASCAGECETETGRLLGAELVVSGRIVKAFGKYKVNLKVHRTDPPALLGAEMMTADDHGGLEEAVRTGTERVLAKVPGARVGAAPAAPAAAPRAPVVAPVAAAPAPSAPSPATPSTGTDWVDYMALERLRTEPWSLALTNGSVSLNDYSIGLSATGWLLRSESFYWQAFRVSYSSLWGELDDYMASATTSVGYRSSVGSDDRSELRIGAGLGGLWVHDGTTIGLDRTYEDLTASAELVYATSYDREWPQFLGEGPRQWVFVLEALFPVGTGSSDCWDSDVCSSDETDWLIDMSYLLHMGVGF